MKIGFISLGLIGGSIAKAIRKKYPDSEIIAYNRSKEPLEAALSDKVIDKAVYDINEDLCDCDYIFLCAPVQTNITFIKKLLPYLKPDTILTDVGSTKGNIHEAISKIAPDVHFIGGHPMAGKEKSSYFNSSAELIDGCYYFITPSAKVNDSEISAFRSLIDSLGCNTITVDPEKHDFIVGAISHVPHMAAYTLVKLVQDRDTPERYMRVTAAGGFKDTTRIASSDPTMWEEICLANSDNLVTLLDDYILKLEEIRTLISDKNGKELHRIFKEAKDYRDSMIN
ncbi:MAG: prephenate dehydrogenase/arogenate dehydrogenase family protein [Lachnospiraceae bacterium]|nr:prephenate dehydrogenase/arogenate dehydrogenase family protein [Lachnospiraceae bacterium]